MAAAPASDAPKGAPSAAEPVACIVIGMAGSGKTTLMQRLHHHLHGLEAPFYSINLDPAVRSLPYAPNIDVRDSVDFKAVMKEYNLGPNGGILTALNLFATKFEQVMGLLEARLGSATPPSHVLLDTPGQIEIFTWSASGALVAESLASALPTVIVYVVDTPRTTRPVTFMSNMLYACSILYKFRLPLLLVFNKTDVVPADFATEWMSDSDAFVHALDEEQAYIGSLSRSMALVLDEFYQSMHSVAVSAVTGEGIDELLEALQRGASEYNATYKPELERRRAKRDAERAEQAASSAERLAADRVAERHAGADAPPPPPSSLPVPEIAPPRPPGAADDDDEEDADAGLVGMAAARDLEADEEAREAAELESFRNYLRQKAAAGPGAAGSEGGAGDSAAGAARSASGSGPTPAAKPP